MRSAARSLRGICRAFPGNVRKEGCARSGLCRAEAVGHCESCVLGRRYAVWPHAGTCRLQAWQAIGPWPEAAGGWEPEGRRLPTWAEAAGPAWGVVVPVVGDGPGPPLGVRGPDCFRSWACRAHWRGAFGHTLELHTRGRTCTP